MFRFLIFLLGMLTVNRPGQREAGWYRADSHGIKEPGSLLRDPGETGSGDVTAEGSQTGTWDIHTGSGNVHIHLPDNAAFDADISTSSGTIDVGQPIEMTVQGRVGDSHKSIHGKVHGGGPTLQVRTGSGDIHIQ